MGPDRARLAAAPPVCLAEAAADCIEVAPAGRLSAGAGAMAAAPGDALADPSLERLLARDVPTPPARLYVLEDVLVHAGSWTVFHAGRPVLETVPGWRRGDLGAFLAAPHFAAHWAAGVSAEIAEPVLCAANAPAGNYAHWHMDCLAGVVLGRLGAGAAPRLLIGAAGPGFQAASLARLAGAGLGEALRATGLVRCRRVFWPSTLDAVPLATPLAGRAYEAIGAAVSGEGTSDGAERLYLARFDAAGRRGIANEPALAEALARKGFRIVTPGELDFDAQVRAAASARVIVGAHGAGLANAGYAGEGATLVELHPAGYGGPAYARLSMLRRLSWRGWIMPTDGAGHAARAHVDVPAFLRQLALWGVV